jgi:hypothetical protein
VRGIVGISEGGLAALIIGFVVVFLTFNHTLGIGYEVLNPFNGLNNINVATAVFFVILFFLLIGLSGGSSVSAVAVFIILFFVLMGNGIGDFWNGGLSGLTSGGAWTGWVILMVFAAVFLFIQTGAGIASSSAIFAFFVFFVAILMATA